MERDELIARAKEIVIKGMKKAGLDKEDQDLIASLDADIINHTVDEELLQRSPCSVLLCLFGWGRESKGWDYWNAVYKTLMDNEIEPCQIGGSHYQGFKIQPTQYAIANNLGFCEGNIVKYVTRYKHKNGLEDLKKAKSYIETLIASYNDQID